MNLPNKLTITRIILTFVFIYFISKDGLSFVVAATLLFILACLTDFADGYIAKKYHLVSDFGKLMDPIADKFLIGKSVKKIVYIPGKIISFVTV